MSSTIKIYSFDIFDTTVIRSFAKPKDVFWLMQERLLRVSDIALPNKLIDSFYILRKKAELYARINARKIGKQEITHQEIYNVLMRWFNLSLEQVSFIKTLEYSIELQSIYPIAKTVEQLNKLRQAQQKVIFTSDMYLPIDVIINMLIKAEVYQGEVVYLSSVHGVSKFQGGLFQLILEKENCRPQELCHWGDDWLSDVASPYRLGIEVFGRERAELAQEMNWYYPRLMQKYLSVMI